MSLVNMLSEAIILMWVLALVVAAIRSEFIHDDTPGPFGLIGMLWRGEIRERMR